MFKTKPNNDSKKMTTNNNKSPLIEMDTKMVFSKYYEYLPYNRQHNESVLSILRCRETGMNKKPWFYTHSICASKFESSHEKPLRYSITNVNETKKDEEFKRLRPRQFEYHPLVPSLMAIGTLDGEVVVMNHETRNIVVSCVSSCRNMKSIIGLCWLNQQPSKLLVGSDNGSLRLYDVNYNQAKGEVIFDDFEQLTSVHVNSTNDRCLASGYSKKVAIYDISNGRCLHLFEDMHCEPINVAKFSNHSPSLFVTSSFDRDVKMWDLRCKLVGPCYSATSSKGNVMIMFSPDDLYLLVSAVDNEVKQLLAADGRIHTDFGIVSTGSAYNYTRSYYMNGRDYIISGSCEESTIRVCCAQSGRRLRDIYLEDTRCGRSIFVQSLRSDPFGHFDMAILAAYARPTSMYEIIKVNLLSSRNSAAEKQGGFNICNSYSKGG